MPKSWRGVVRLLAAVALVALVQPLFVTLAAPGKEFPKCIKACDDARRECEDRCVTDCLAMFPAPEEEALRQACRDACHAICVEQQQDCKERCRRGDMTPTEP